MTASAINAVFNKQKSTIKFLLKTALNAYPMTNMM